mgnify:FL=1|jgi:hypothetical protein
MLFECIVLKEKGGDLRRVGGVIDLDVESIEQRVVLVSTDLCGIFVVEERYPLSVRVSQIIHDTEERLSGVDVSLRQFAALVYLEGRRDVREELLELFRKKMTPGMN